MDGDDFGKQTLDPKTTSLSHFVLLRMGNWPQPDLTLALTPPGPSKSTTSDLRLFYHLLTNDIKSQGNQCEYPGNPQFFICSICLDISKGCPGRGC